MKNVSKSRSIYQDVLFSGGSVLWKRIELVLLMH